MDFFQSNSFGLKWPWCSRFLGGQIVPKYRYLVRPILSLLCLYIEKVEIWSGVIDPSQTDTQTTE